jgi:hypothetical protein
MYTCELRRRGGPTNVISFVIDVYQIAGAFSQGFAVSGAECLGQSRSLIHVEIVDLRQRWVFRVRLLLIPVNSGRNIVL